MDDMPRVGGWVLLAAGLAACSHGPRTGAPVEATHPSPLPESPAGPKGTLALGAPIASPFVALSEIAKSPGRYENKEVTTGGKVTAVCQAMGCWMELADEASHAHVRMHGHTFFVPKTAAGHVARVQATVLRGAGEDCEDSPAPSSPMVAKVEPDATGVELDPASSSL
jgi:hypothetical protein